MKKYSGREERRARDLCHKVLREVVDFAKRHGFGILIEDLKSIRGT
jgi:sugar phosphate isomerase/epimerase